MSNKTFIATYDEICEGYKKLHNMILDDIRVLFISGLGQREIGTVADCRDFNAIAAKGSVLITRDRGAFLKISDQHWVTADRLDAEGIRHEVDLIRMLADYDGMATLIDPGVQE